MTERVVNQARNAGDKSLSFELIHGLPHQTRERFASTMQIVLGMRPERIALYNYAHMPSLFKSQRLINEQAVVVMEEGRRKAMRFIASAFDSRQGRVAEPGRYSKAVSGIRTPIPKLCEDSLGAPAGPK